MNENENIREENGTAVSATENAHATDAESASVSAENTPEATEPTAENTTEGAANLSPTAEYCADSATDEASATDAGSVPESSAEGVAAASGANEDRAKLVIEAAIAEARARAAEEARIRTKGARSFESNSFVSYVEDKKAYKGYDRVESSGKKKSDLSVLSWALFMLTFLSAFAALFVLIVSAITKENLTYVILLLSSVCIANVVVGFIVLKRGVHGFKNLLVGFIGGLCFVLMVTISDPITNQDDNGIFDNLFDDGDEAIVAEVIEDIEIKTGLRLPDEYDDFYAYSSSIRSEITLYYEDEASVNDLLSAMSSHGKFINKLPTALLGCLPPAERTYDEDLYYLIYNEGDGRFNALPMASGNYDMIAVIVEFYDDDDATVQAYEYSITFISEHDSIIALQNKDEEYA